MFGAEELRWLRLLVYYTNTVQLGSKGFLDHNVRGCVDSARVSFALVSFALIQYTSVLPDDAQMWFNDGDTDM